MAEAYCLLVSALLPSLPIAPVSQLAPTIPWRIPMLPTMERGARLPRGISRINSRESDSGTSSCDLALASAARCPTSHRTRPSLATLRSVNSSDDLTPLERRAPSSTSGSSSHYSAATTTSAVELQQHRLATYVTNLNRHEAEDKLLALGRPGTCILRETSNAHRIALTTYTSHRELIHQSLDDCTDSTETQLFCLSRLCVTTPRRRLLAMLGFDAWWTQPAGPGTVVAVPVMGQQSCV